MALFEAYTSLTTGTYTFIDKTTGTPVHLCPGRFCRSIEGQDASSIAAAKRSIALILILIRQCIPSLEIQEVGLWFSGYNRITNVLTYDANGIWKAADIAIVWIGAVMG